MNFGEQQPQAAPQGWDGGWWCLGFGKPNSIACRHVRQSYTINASFSAPTVRSPSAPTVRFPSAPTVRLTINKKSSVSVVSRSLIAIENLRSASLWCLFFSPLSLGRTKRVDFAIPSFVFVQVHKCLAGCIA